MLLLIGAVYAFALRLPYCNLDSDAANFALMGEDVYHYGHLTTLAYGQNYLFSITPYVYAAFKVILPKTVPWAVILAAADGIIALAGLWMIFQSFLAAADQTLRRSAVAAVLFCVLLLALPRHLIDFAGHASLEQGYLTLGLLMLSASRLAAALRAGQTSRWYWWLLAGLAFGHGIFSRPQVCAYGVITLVLLLWQQWRTGSGRKLWAGGGWLAAGLLVGCLPMILHWIFRAPTWPFTMTLDSHLADATVQGRSFDILIHQVIPMVFSFGVKWWGHPYTKAN